MSNQYNAATIQMAIEQLRSDIKNTHDDVKGILVQLKTLNGTVRVHDEKIGKNERDLQFHGTKLDGLTERVTRIEAGEKVETKFQDEIRADQKKESAWTRTQIMDILKTVLPWVAVVGFLAKEFFK